MSLVPPNSAGSSRRTGANTARSSPRAISQHRIEICPAGVAIGAQSAHMPAAMNKTQSIISIRNLSKTYESGFQALKNINLEIRRGEIFALLGPNGAGKTTLIGIVCGIVNATSGSITVDGHDHVRDYRAARTK